jgi:hypothetical protein
MAILVAVSLLSLIKLLRQEVPGHYRVFTGAGRALWQGQNPYGTDFGTSVGYYFYSPSCALTVFGPLAMLPEKLGLIVFMAASWMVFVWGARKFADVCRLSPSHLQWFWGLIAAQMAGGVLASKLEIAIAGILLGAIAELIQKPRFGRSAVAVAAALAAVLNWKFQPLPVVGLLLIAWIWRIRDWRFPAAIGVALAVWYALPFAFFPVEFVRSIHETWQTTFSHFVAESVLNFENIFAFLHAVTGKAISFEDTQLISGAMGFSLALGLAIHLYRGSPFEPAVLLAVTMGTMFMTVFSPLGQNNALILYAPLLLCALIAHGRAHDRRRLQWTIGVVCAVMILAYSDLVPRAVREALRHLSIKSVACFALGMPIARQIRKEMYDRPALD